VVDDCEGAAAVCAAIVAGITRIRLARMNTDKCFNTHPILSKYCV
jgi:hypothetical protein